MARNLAKAEPTIEPLRPVIFTGDVEHDGGGGGSPGTPLDGSHDHGSKTGAAQLRRETDVDDAPILTAGVKIQPANWRVLTEDQQKIRLRKSRYIAAVLEIELVIQKRTQLFGRPAKRHELVNAERTIQLAQES